MTVLKWVGLTLAAIWLGVFVAEIFWYICQGIRAAY
jgi:hypothetical protein